MYSPDGILRESRRDENKCKPSHPFNHEVRGVVWLRIMPPFSRRAARNCSHRRVTTGIAESGCTPPWLFRASMRLPRSWAADYVSYVVTWSQGSHSLLMACGAEWRGKRRKGHLLQELSVISLRDTVPWCAFLRVLHTTATHACVAADNSSPSCMLCILREGFILSVTGTVVRVLRLELVEQVQYA